MYRFNLEIVRRELSDLAFEHGKREVLVGRLSELLPEQSQSRVDEQLREWEREFKRHSLIFTRHHDDPDKLYVVQELRPPQASDRAWTAEAMKWVSKITTISLAMLLPAFAGIWIDHRCGTEVFALLGLTLGVPLGIYHLVLTTKKL